MAPNNEHRGLDMDSTVLQMADGTDTDSVHADVNYVRNAPRDGEPPLTFVTSDETSSTMITQPGVVVEIENMRGKSTSLDREGFILAPHVSSLANLHLIEEDETADALYIEEMAELAKQVTGASFVVMQGGGKKRYGNSAAQHSGGVLKNALPALYPHGDSTDASAEMLARAFSGPAYETFNRWALINMWRPITAPPQDYPLAVCDARTIGPDDATTVMALTETRATGAFSFPTKGYIRNPEHRWCYYRDMTPGEVLIFKTHDTDPVRAHQVAHTAFADPSCPAGTPTRGSVEMRAFCGFT